MPRELVLVTGAAGFIGSHLVRRLRTEGYPVVGIDALRGATDAQVAVARLGDLADDPGFDLIELDLTGEDLARTVAEIGPTAIFHLAARPGARDIDVTALRRDNVQATQNLVTAATTAGVPDLVLSSSSSVYGDAGARAASRENHAIAAMSPYAETKRAAELLCLRAPLRSRVVRLFTVYGPGQRPDMAFQRFITASLAGTSAPLYSRFDAARDFTSVTDAVEGLLLAWQRGKSPVYNVSGGEVVRLAETRQLIEELTGAALTTHLMQAPPQPSATRADLSLARLELGYRPRVDLRAGLSSQVAAAVADAGLARNR